ncbi:hypothetical protein K469DRAFT_701080 [Zopfia rhizophila CBS 207.26]|uniref:Uncharacterized protein n=1 Tax=Zopfia rhizophila CBS 207.26 TaxID=1314779 RepID=A0A6A6EEV9_9PEZI|nr:hypothetical protein K469DRAFT_701080 [Zopfia rhizophila CBS 207.26]
MVIGEAGGWCYPCRIHSFRKGPSSLKPASPHNVTSSSQLQTPSNRDIPLLFPSALAAQLQLDNLAMVLQDVGSPSSDGSGDNPYPSDNDPYSSASGSPYRLDKSQLPQPIPILGPFLGFSAPVLNFKTQAALKYAEKKVQRVLTPEEAQALATHINKMEQTKSYATTAGASLGVWRWHSTFSTCRYPLYQPKPEDINPNKFLFIKGPAAHYVRHSWRFFLYAFVAGEMGKLLGQIYAQPIAASSSANDPRLSQFGKDLKVAVEGERKGFNKMREHQARVDPSSAWKQGELPGKDLPPYAGAPRPLGRPRKPTPTPTEDDMSPTASNDPWPLTSTDSPYGDSGYFSDSHQAPKQEPPQATSPWGRSPVRSDDDASPTGGLFQDEVQNKSKPGESAWERLRRAGGPPSGQLPPSRRPEPPQRDQREGSTLGDNFTFADSEEERKRAQERAQKEFNERIERERQGKDVNDERRRW